MLSDKDRTLKALYDRAQITAIIFLLACGSVVAVPFYSNQNQYLAHALSNIGAGAERDWFRNTLDPYPFFSAVAGSAYGWFGIDGIRVLAFLGTVVAMASVFWLAQLLARQSGRPDTAIFSTVAVGLTLPPHVNAFAGVASQYIISTPAYLQPSMFGCLLLLAIPCLLAALTTKSGGARAPLLLAAFVLATLGCALHPTYIVSAGILLTAAFAANVWQREKLHILYFALAGAALVAITIAANPALLSMAISSPEYSRAVQRFAFERIPQHTQWANWKVSNINLIMLVLAAIPLAGKLKQPWLAHFLLASLAIGATATLIVQLSGQAKLALLFPWRVSVFIVPVSFTVIAVWVTGHIERMALLWNWRRLAAVLASCAALYGCIGTLRAKSPAETDAGTALAKAVHPSGVGLVPLDSDDLRLNASVNIYVDWKSPPYAGTDLIEWWRRVDQVRQFARDAEQFCSIRWHAPIRWILLPVGGKPPSCVSRWRNVGQTAKWRILAKDDRHLPTRNVR